MIKGEAMQVLDGAMLSDGNMYPARNSGDASSRYLNSYFRMQLVGHEHQDLLLVLKVALQALDVDVRPKYPKPYWRPSDSTWTEWLVSRTSEYVTGQRRRWYSSNVKVVPLDFVLTPASLAVAFMGDGSSSPNGSQSVQVNISLYSFTAIEAYRILTQMPSLGIEAGIALCAAGPVITVHQPSVNHFMDVVEPYTTPSYKYKIKRR